MKDTMPLTNPVPFQPRNRHLELLPERAAYPIDFPGYEPVKFYLFKSDGLWSIAEASTGMPITRGAGSRHEARDRAIGVLQQQGKEKLQQVIALQMERILDRVGTESLVEISK